MRTIVFAFHYIRNDTYANPGIHPFSIDRFIDILTFCKNEGNILTPENFFEKKLENEKINFLFTFDDGLIDHFRILPLMDQFHVKGIFFICSSYYRDKKLLNVHKIHHARSHIPEKIFRDYFFIKMDKLYFDYNKYKSSANKFYSFDNPENSLMKYLLNFILDPNLIDELLFDISSDYKLNFDHIASQLYLNLDQIKMIKKKGHIIGLHSDTHQNMTRFSEIESNKEIELNKNFFKEFDLSSKYKCFAFPYGREIALPRKLNNFRLNHDLDYCFSMEKKINTNFYNKDNIYRFSPNNFHSIINQYI